MKKISLLASIIFSLFSCKKDNDSNTYKVKYTVSGSSSQFKISYDALVIRSTNADTDTDDKTQVRIQYSLPK